jgi:hypothetical protein
VSELVRFVDQDMNRPRTERQKQISQKVQELVCHNLWKHEEPWKAENLGAVDSDLFSGVVAISSNPTSISAFQILASIDKHAGISYSFSVPVKSQ